MNDRKLIGRVSATEKYPSSCDDFQFWLADDAILSPFDIVRVENKTDDSMTYGVVQDILHITDGTGHLSNYVSSDFGNVDTTPMTRRLSLSYAKVSVIHNTKENFMPVFEGSPVYTADKMDIEIALGLDNIDEKTAIPAGLMKASNNVAVPIKYNGDFLIGPEGAHMNISGISGLATKTSYVMFLLKAIQHKYKDDVAIIVMNVKGDDLLHVHQPKQHLLLLDNNVLNTVDLKSLVDDLCTAGFGRGAKYVDPGAYNIVMMRYKNGDRAEFLDKKMAAYLESFKKRIKSAEMLETFLQVVIGAEDAEDYAQYMLEHEEELSPIIEKYRSKAKKARYLDFNQGVDGRKINDENMEQLARLAIYPLRIAFDDIKLKDVYCKAVRTAHRHGINQISNYILFNYKDKPEDLYERLRVNIELNEELGIQIFSFPMKYSPINETDRTYIGANWCKKSVRAISAILQVTKGVVAAGSSFFYKAFGKNLEEYHEILAMPRELIMFRSYFEKNGTTARWQTLYRQLTNEQKERLMRLVSLNVSELRNTPWPSDLADILEFYLLKYSGKTEQNQEKYVQMSLMDDSDVVLED